MKKILGVIFLSLALSGSAYAGIWSSKKSELLMHDYLNDGWELKFVNTVMDHALYYVFTLQKKNKVVVCKIKNNHQEKCIEPR